MNPFIAHLIGDFILQNEWMAMNKRNSSWACLVHVLVYITPFLLTGLEWWQLLWIAATHFLQDRTGFVLWWIKHFKRVPPEHIGVIPLMVDQAFHLIMIELSLLLSGTF